MSSVSKRLFKDLERATSAEVKKQGLYYWYDDANVLIGKALVTGLDDTPYEGLLGYFNFQFSKEYPFAPPQVTWSTWDGSTRFHPQLYVGGKVCLSILGTWSGPGWSSMMNIESILVILQSLFVENPLACEPSYEKGTLDDPKYKNYRDNVEHQVIWYMFKQISMWQQNKKGHIWEPFEEDVDKVLPLLFKKMKKKVLAQTTEQSWPTLAFGSFGKTRWNLLKEMVPKIEAGFLTTQKVE